MEHALYLFCPVENKEDLADKLLHRYPLLYTSKIRGNKPDLQQVLKHGLSHYTISIAPLALITLFTYYQVNILWLKTIIRNLSAASHKAAFYIFFSFMSGLDASL